MCTDMCTELHISIKCDSGIHAESYKLVLQLQRGIHVEVNKYVLK